MTGNGFPFVDYAQPSQPFCGLVILGEAPGAAEVEQGRPFVGRSGQLLQNCLNAAGIDRRACLVANVFRYRPPGNNAGAFFERLRDARAAGNVRGLGFGAQALGICRAEFMPEIDHLTEALRTARAVLSLGAVPLWATTGKRGLSQLAGTVQPCRLAALPVFPTYHPAYILRGKFHLIPAYQDHMRRAYAAALGANNGQ